MTVCTFRKTTALLHGQDTTVTNLEGKMWDFVIVLNLKGVSLGCKYGIPDITMAGGSSIIDLSSLAGILGVGDIHAYTAAKGGVVSDSSHRYGVCLEEYPRNRHLPTGGVHLTYDRSRPAQLDS